MVLGRVVCELDLFMRSWVLWVFLVVVYRIFQPSSGR